MGMRYSFDGSGPMSADLAYAGAQGAADRASDRESAYAIVLALHGPEMAQAYDDGYCQQARCLPPMAQLGQRHAVDNRLAKYFKK